MSRPLRFPPSAAMEVDDGEGLTFSSLSSPFAPSPSPSHTSGNAGYMHQRGGFASSSRSGPGGFGAAALGGSDPRHSASRSFGGSGAAAASSEPFSFGSGGGAYRSEGMGGGGGGGYRPAYRERQEGQSGHSTHAQPQPRALPRSSSEHAVAPPARTSALHAAIGARTGGGAAAGIHAPFAPPRQASFGGGAARAGSYSNLQAAIPAVPARAAAPVEEEDPDLALARRLQAEEEQAHRLRRGHHHHHHSHERERERVRAPLAPFGSSVDLAHDDDSFGGGGSASWGGQGASRSGVDSAIQARHTFLPPPDRPNTASARSGSGMAAAAGSAGRAQEESDFALAQRLEREELERLQHQESRREARNWAGGRVGRSESGLSDDSGDVRSVMAAAGAERLARRLERERADELAAMVRHQNAERSRGGGGGSEHRFDIGEYDQLVSHIRAHLGERLRSGGGSGFGGLHGGGGMGMGMGMGDWSPFGHSHGPGGGRRGGGGRHHAADELDIDSMDYEQLLALSERMGDVKSKGLTKSQIRKLPATKYVKKKKKGAAASGPSQSPPSASASAASSSAHPRASPGLKRKSDDELSEGSVSDLPASGTTASFKPGLAAKRSKKARRGGGARATVQQTDDDDIIDLRDLNEPVSSIRPASSAAADAAGASRPPPNPHTPLYTSLLPAPSSAPLTAAPAAAATRPNRFSSGEDDEDLPIFMPPDMMRQAHPGGRAEGQEEDDDEMQPLSQRLFGGSKAHSAVTATPPSKHKHVNRIGGKPEPVTDSPGAAAAIAAVEAAERGAAAAAPVPAPAPAPSASLPSQPEEEEEDEEECCICLTAFEEGDLVKRLQCSHLFHAKELDEWLHTSKMCPICRQPCDL